MLCRHSLWMMPIKVQIVIHLIQFAPQSITWASTKAYIHLTFRVRLLITWPTYQPTWGRSKMPWDEINGQRILTAQAIRLSDHRAAYDAKCGRPQRGGGGWSNADRGVKDLADVHKLVLFFIVSALSLWMMPIKVQIVIHLIQFVPQTIIWAGTKVVNYMTHISAHME